MASSTALGGRRATLDAVTSAWGMVKALEGRLERRGCVFVDYRKVVAWQV